MPWTPEEFFEKATGAKHPLEMPASAPDDLKRTVYDMLVMGPKDWAARADEKLNGWEKFAKADEPLEKALHEAIRRRKGGERIFPTVASKNIRLFKKILSDLGYQDWVIADLLRDGFPLVGKLDESGVFPRREAREIMHGADPKWLEQTAAEARAMLHESLQNRAMDDTMLEVYAKTCVGEDSEKAKKWALGPFTFQQMSDRHKGKEWIGCRRFGVIQGTKVDDEGVEHPKVRQIDDLSEYFVNACVTCTDKITLCGVDGIVNFIRVWADAVRQAKFVGN